MKNLALLLIAILLSILIFPIALMYAIVTRGLNTLGRDSWNNAIAIDQLGNVWCKHLFNDLMCHSDGHRFGDPNETVSHVLGKNKALNKLYPIGKALAWLLNKIDENHVEKANINKQ